jgi:hypothetical protein
MPLSVGTTINKFRKRILDLKSLDVRTGPSILDDLKIPWTYCMSPALVPKPHDWEDNIGNPTHLATGLSLLNSAADVVGFYFLDLATNYHPPADLAAFLSIGEPPICIG